VNQERIEREQANRDTLVEKLKHLREQFSRATDPMEKKYLKAEIGRTRDNIDEKDLAINNLARSAQRKETVARLSVKYAKEEVPLEKLFGDVLRESAEDKRKAEAQSYIEKKRQEIAAKRSRHRK